jgi:sec-independent protein translocase protein TatA
MLNGWEIVLALGIILLLFGAKKLPELARGMGQGIREFKKATREVSEEVRASIEADPMTHEPAPRRSASSDPS